MEAAKREVLARAYHDALADAASLPSSAEVDRYYESMPALFAQRRFYTVQDSQVEGRADELVAIVPKVEAAADADQALDVLREAQVRVTTRRLSVSPEDVPLALVDRLAGLRDGQSLMLAQPGGARVITVLSSAPAPLAREAARPRIQAFLANERKRKAVRDGMKSLRDQATIQYRGAFAVPAASAASAPTG
jgi:EpsD family peptidyl-prolyl cis-trans isomerase